ncbi:hypothetical protein U1Q18_041450 [Sarracenia purpurea var. burkii]
MGDTENTLPPSKKRSAGRELSRDNPGLDDEDESSEQETGSFKRASDEVLASRKIVRVRRHQPSSTTPSVPSSNPFAGIRLVPMADSTSTAPEITKLESEKTGPEEVDGNINANKENDKANDKAEAESFVDEKKPDTVNEEGKPELADEKAKEEDKTENEEKGAAEAEEESVVDEKKLDTVNEGAKPELADEKAATVEDKTENEGNKDIDGSTFEKKDGKSNGNENIEKSAEAASFSSFHQLSSIQNPFTGLAGTGFSGSTFSFGVLPKDGSPLVSGSGTPPIFGNSPFSFSLPNNGNSSLFGKASTSLGTKSEGSGLPSMQEVPVETGEENEKTVFTADSVLFEFIEGGWKERGKGELKLNVPTIGTGIARLVMRARGNYRLILNASLYPDMKLANMDKRGITFACVNCTGEEGKDGLSTFALKFKDGSVVEEFDAAVTEYKGKAPPAVMKTPENSPKEPGD